MKRILIAMMVGLSCLGAVAQPMAEPAAPVTTTHDGSWWKEKSGTYKEAFIVGYKEGVEHVTPATKHSVWTTTRAKPLMDGLNEFYKDFRNTNIYIDEAMAYVQDELQGATDESLKAELQKLRQAAAARKE